MADSRPGAVALVTGANSGIGKDIARQLALTGRYTSVLIGSRSAQKGEAAKAELEKATGLRVFGVLPLNLSEGVAVRSAASRLTTPITDLVLNAGGFGGKDPFALTRDGVTEIVASNVLGHAVLLDELLKRDLLIRSAVFAGSEAARGVSQMGIKRPQLESGSVDEFTSLLDGTRFRRDRLGNNAAYAWAKIIGALWIAHMARVYSGVRMVTMSPGGTAGTGAADVYPQPARFLVKHIVMPGLLPLFGMAHGLDVGAKRLVDAVLNDGFRAGVFYASRTKASGAVSDQAGQFPVLADVAVQDAAAKALDAFVQVSRGRGVPNSFRMESAR